MRKHNKSGGLTGLVLMLLLSLPVMAYQNGVTESGPPLIADIQYELVGQTDIHWLWVKLYKAELRTASGQYHGQARSLSLELTYERAFSREQLITATLKEWQRQNTDYNPRWLDELQHIWPDIKPKDSLLLLVDDQGHGHFYYNKTLIGALKEAVFTQAFINIWLSENTFHPASRQQLIGSES